jgi:transposase
MIGLRPRARVYAYASPADLRKGFDGLTALVEQELGCEALSGDLFLFVSRDRIRAKVLVFDGSGLCLLSKRLERGQFASLWREGEGGALRLSQGELSLFLEGSQLVGRRRLVPEDMTEKDLALGARL